MEPEQNRVVSANELATLDAFPGSTPEPILDLETGNASKVVLVVCRNCETLDEPRCPNQDIGVPDRLTTGPERGVNLRGLDDDVVAQTKNFTGRAELIEGFRLGDSVLCL